MVKRSEPCKVCCHNERGTLIVIRSEREGSAGVVRGTLSVILNECEGSITVVRKMVRR